jgi:hypothetical protein
VWRCPNGCRIRRGVVCGGDVPFHNHGAAGVAPPNVYFLMSLPAGRYTRECVTPLPFDLTEEDWQALYDHADGGCAAEPQCPVCLAYLERVPPRPGP